MSMGESGREARLASIREKIGRGTPVTRHALAQGVPAACVTMEERLVGRRATPVVSVIGILMVHVFVPDTHVIPTGCFDPVS
jgi:hypothetical protein